MNFEIVKHMGRLAAAFAVGILTVCFGPLMPAFQAGKYGGAYINLVWDTVYGIGFSLTGIVFDYQAIRPPLALIGFVVWPLLIFCAVSYCTWSALRKNVPSWVKVFLLLLLVISFAFNVKVGWRFEHLNRLPSFQKSSDVTF